MDMAALSLVFPVAIAAAAGVPLFVAPSFSVFGRGSRHITPRSLVDHSDRTLGRRFTTKEAELVAETMTGRQGHTRVTEADFGGFMKDPLYSQFEVVVNGTVLRTAVRRMALAFAQPMGNRQAALDALHRFSQDIADAKDRMDPSRRLMVPPRVLYSTLNSLGLAFSTPELERMGQRYQLLSEDMAAYPELFQRIDDLCRTARDVVDAVEVLWSRINAAASTAVSDPMQVLRTLAAEDRDGDFAVTLEAVQSLLGRLGFSLNEAEFGRMAQGLTSPGSTKVLLHSFAVAVVVVALAMSD